MVSPLLPVALQHAAAHLRERGDFHFLNDEPEIFTTFQLATLLDRFAHRLLAGDDREVNRLWYIFAVASTWDDAGGDSQIGQQVFDLIDAFRRPA